MKTQRFAQVLFLGLAMLIGVFALSQAFHEVSYAGGECSVYCVCHPGCGLAEHPNQPCFDNEVCGGGAGNPGTCGDYCVTQ